MNNKTFISPLWLLSNFGNWETTYYNKRCFHWSYIAQLIPRVWRALQKPIIYFLSWIPIAQIVFHVPQCCLQDNSHNKFLLVLDTKTASTEELEFSVLLDKENYVTYCVSFCFITRHLRTTYLRSCSTFSSDARKTRAPSASFRWMPSCFISECQVLFWFINSQQTQEANGAHILMWFFFQSVFERLWSIYNQNSDTRPKTINTD